MNCKLSLLLFTIVVAAEAAELVTRRSAPPTNSGLGIYDGEKTTIKQHPYEGGLLLNKAFFCAVTIITDSWVLTLGDCTYGASPSDFSVVVGSSDGTTGKTYNVKKVVIHPKYGQNMLDYDYALLQIDGKFSWSDTIKAVKLPSKAAKAGTVLTASGWGSTDSVGVDQSNAQFLQGNLTLQTPKFCAKTYADFGFPWTKRMSCAYNKGKTTLCTGDWADPLVNSGTLHAIFAAGASDGFCTKEASPVILANIDAVSPWIKKTTGAKYEDEE